MYEPFFSRKELYESTKRQNGFNFSLINFTNDRFCCKTTNTFFSHLDGSLVGSKEPNDPFAFYLFYDNGSATFSLYLLHNLTTGANNSAYRRPRYFYHAKPRSMFFIS